MQNWTGKLSKISRALEREIYEWKSNLWNLSGSIKRNNGKWSTSSESSNIVQRRVKRKRKIEENFTCAVQSQFFARRYASLSKSSSYVIKKEKTRGEKRPQTTSIETWKGEVWTCGERWVSIWKFNVKPIKGFEFFVRRIGPINTSEWKTKSYLKVEPRTCFDRSSDGFKWTTRATIRLNPSLESIVACFRVCFKI